MKKIIGLALICLPAEAAFAGTISTSAYAEQELNNTPATANFIGAFTHVGGAFIATGHVVPGDVDWYSFSVPNFGFVSAGVYSDQPAADAGDSTMQLLNGDLHEYRFNDDGYLAGHLSNFVFTTFVVPDQFRPGTNYIGISGYADGVLFNTPLDGIDDFTGLPHTQNFDYQLVVSFDIPEPATICLLILGGIAALRRSRQA